MANPRLTFNSIDLDFPSGLSDYRPPRKFLGDQHVTDGGITESVNLGNFHELEIALETFNSAAFFRALHAWWAWAGRGKQYAFAFDSGKTGNTTLASAGAPTDTHVEVVSVSGFAVGDEMIVESADLLYRERKLISSIDSGAKTMSFVSAALVYSFPIGSIVRIADYWPKLVSIDRDQPFSELPAQLYTLRHRCREDRA